MTFSYKLILAAALCLSALSGCGIDTEAGLCTYMGACTEDPEEKKEKADKKWWCEYYSGKNCGDDAAPAATGKSNDAGGMDHSSSGQDDN